MGVNKSKNSAGPKAVTFHRTGKCVEKPPTSEILLCACGGKYIKSRPTQTTCIMCIAKTSRLRQ